MEDAHAAVIDVQKLYPLAVKVSGLMHHDSVHKFVDQLRCQRFQLCDLFDFLNEPLQALGLIRFCFQIGLHLRDGGFQRFLLFLVGQGQGGVALVR